MDGQPFFCVTRVIDPGLQKTLEADIVPRLLTDIPGQPSAAALAAVPIRGDEGEPLDMRMGAWVASL